LTVQEAGVVKQGEFAKWRRSSRCSDGMCVEAAADHGEVLVRSSTRPDQVLRLSAEQWGTLLAAIKAGDL
jgi:hypothetical protein